MLIKVYSSFQRGVLNRISDNLNLQCTQQFSLFIDQVTCLAYRENNLDATCRGYYFQTYDHISLFSYRLRQILGFLCRLVSSQELKFWENNINSLNVKKLFNYKPLRIMSFADASSTGCGTILSLYNMMP